MFIISIIISIPQTQQPVYNRLAQIKPTAGLSSLNELMSFVLDRFLDIY